MDSESSRSASRADSGSGTGKTPNRPQAFPLGIRDFITVRQLIALREATPDVIFQIAKDGRFQCFPAQDEGDEFLSQALTQVLPPHASTLFAPHAHRAFETGKLQVFEYEVEFEGELHQCEGRMVVCDESNVLLVVRDITDYKRIKTQLAEQIEELKATNDELVRSEARTRAIIRHIADGVAVSSSEGQLELYNEAAEEMLGVDLAHAESFDWSSIMTVSTPDGPVACPEHASSMLEAVNHGEVRSIEMTVQHPGSTDPRTIKAHAAPILDESGRPDGGVIAMQDITQHRRSQRLLQRAYAELELRVQERTQELRASEAKYHDLYHNAPDMYVTVDTSNAKIIDCNQTVVRRTGYRQSEIIGRSVFDMYDPDCASIARSAFEAFRDTGHFDGAELKLHCKDDSTIDVLLNASAVRDDLGRVTQGLMIWRDITERKRAEQLLSQNRDDLAHATRLHSMGEMAAGLAHELNQPLSAIVNYSRGFDRRVANVPGILPELREATSAIVSEAERASGIIDGLRRLVGMCEASSVDLNINEIVTRAVDLCMVEARRKQVMIHCELGESIRYTRADPIQIEQVIVCLVLNAIESVCSIDAIERNEVMVSTGAANERSIEVRVRDFGKGVARENLVKVFEPFYTTKPNGMGMGLAIGRSIVEAHGGRIWAESDADAGTTFKFSLPAITRVAA